MKLFYINRHDSRCISPEGLNLAYIAAPLLLIGLPLFAVALALTF